MARRDKQPWRDLGDYGVEVLNRRLFAVAAVLFAATASIPVTTAAGATTKCVALVVDFHAFGGKVSTSCVTVDSNATGSNVLESGGHQVTYDPRYPGNFVCKIDGLPKDGCRSVDNTHYWAYYHRAPGSTKWELSTEGAGTYDPANASTEGWVYDNGQTNAPQPTNVPYGSICTATASPTPTGSASPSSTSSTASTAPTSPTHSATVQPTPTPSPSASTASATSSPTAAPVLRGVTNSAPALVFPTTPPSTPAAALTVAHSHGGSGPPIALIVGLSAAAALAVAAATRLRRSPE